MQSIDLIDSQFGWRNPEEFPITTEFYKYFSNKDSINPILTTDPVHSAYSNNKYISIPVFWYKASHSVCAPLALRLQSCSVRAHFGSAGVDWSLNWTQVELYIRHRHIFDIDIFDIDNGFTFLAITRRPSNENNHLIHRSKAPFKLYRSRWVSGSASMLKSEFSMKRLFFTFSVITRRPSHERNHLIHRSKALFKLYRSRWVSRSVSRQKRLVFDGKNIFIYVLHF